MLYIMRHGKTDWNNLKKIQGRTDIPLNEEGRKMAEEAKEEYKDVHFDVCYASDLRRTQDTARIILAAGHEGLEMRLDPGLREWNLGVWEGHTMQEVAGFVTTKLSVLETVLSTATHFILKKYKDHGTILTKKYEDTREIMTP